MMKNRAGLVALLVLAIAVVVMVFFVLPNRDAVEEVADNAASAVQESASSAADTAAEKAARLEETVNEAGVLEKVERLRSDAEAAAASLQSLFANGRVPSQEELAEAKAKTQAALQAIADFEAPEGLNADALNNVVASMKEKASQALEMVRSMPEDAASAANAVAGLKGLFGAAPEQNMTAEATSSDNAASEAEGADDQGSETAEATEATETAPAAETSEEEAADAANAADAVMPAFDILRVEKDGSTVIAGKGEPGATINLVDGDQTIASQVIGNSGDFAIVLDNPLAAGDHQLVLRTEGTNGQVTTSEEVATVSVPETSNGELLAMVSKPGEPSRILTMPAAETSAATETASAETTAAETSEPQQPSASEGEATSEAETAAASETTAESVEAEATPDVANNAEIRVTAVELEGDKIFVAGNAKPGATLKVYAGDQLIDEVVADTNGHFVAEGEMQLAVGNHIIRADVVEPESGKVIVRASVPFNRPEGARISVAANTANTGVATTGEDGKVADQLNQLREETAKAIVLLKDLFANGQTPAPDALAAARSATVIALNTLASFKPGPDASEELVAAASKASTSAAAALKIINEAGESASDVAAVIADLEAAAADAITPVTGNVVGSAAVETSAAQEPAAETANTEAETTSANTATRDVASAEPEAAEPKTIEQAPLEASDNSVIIRRGDTLWQISRRLYGKGVRYTTIYLANQQKIGDPNVIEPGQVFTVPAETLEDDATAEQTNKRLQSQ